MIRNASFNTRALFFGALFLLVQLTMSAQIFQPVKWKFSIKPLENNEYEINASATIEDTWHVYALSVSDKPDAIGPIPTTLKVNASTDFELVGKTKEGKYITHFDPNFEMDLNYFEKTAVFKQRIKAKTDKPFSVSGVLEYMACNDERCIFPDPELFDLKITPNASGEEVVAEETASSSLLWRAEKKITPTGVSP